MKRTSITESEIVQVIIAIVVLALVIGFQFIINQETDLFLTSFLYAFIIIGLSVGVKKLVAYALDADVEHKLWSFSRYGIKPGSKLKKEFPAGIVLPLFITVISLGLVKIMTLLTYETKALRHRASKRFGRYSFTEMTDWHNAVIGASGVVVLLVLSFITYFIPSTNLEILARMASYYALFSILPLGKLDGNQIYFGSRVLYAILATITLIFTAYSFLLI